MVIFPGEGGAETWEGEREEPTQEQASVLEKGGRILFRLKNIKTYLVNVQKTEFCNGHYPDALARERLETSTGLSTEAVQVFKQR